MSAPGSRSSAFLRVSARWIRSLALPLVIATAGGTVGCGPSCDRDSGKPVGVTEGATDRERGFYESAPLEGPFIEFPAGRTYHFMHRLGAVPRSFQTYLAFDEYPKDFVEAAGNQVTYEPPTDEYVAVRNDTCSLVRIRVTAWNPVLESEGPDGGPPAGADAAP